MTALRLVLAIALFIASAVLYSLALGRMAPGRWSSAENALAACFFAGAWATVIYELRQRARIHARMLDWEARATRAEGALLYIIRMHYGEERHAVVMHELRLGSCAGDSLLEDAPDALRKVQDQIFDEMLRRMEGRPARPKS
jgi:hypothetical protein